MTSLTPLFLLLFPAIALAANPTYQVNGIYPGMSAAELKAAGFTACAPSDSTTVICRSTVKQKTYLDLPIEDFQVSLVAPYQSVDRVTIKVGVVRLKKKGCEATSGKWGQLIPVDCGVTASDAITKAYGAPVKRLMWHKCALDTLEISDGTITLYRADPDWTAGRKQDCEMKAAETARQEKVRGEQNSFLKAMK